MILPCLARGESKKDFGLSTEFEKTIVFQRDFQKIFISFYTFQLIFVHFSLRKFKNLPNALENVLKFRKKKQSEFFG